ncbi:hypothetical protein [Microbacterium dauci]|uniref:Uncharacterized protein n=1 Tax=Microbacterium dauci TaxID=3048008 RepID=A0ABT6ZCC8_9MICO|nr:hypothetical protein [Microbacterium sp. LX3-4]MDJ1113793.1 hypothetical protein [Microbacterium sp. LX3-4]
MITGIPEGSIVLTPQAARIAYALLGIGEKRTQMSSSTQGWQVLNAITQCAFHSPAAIGKEQRQDPASEEREWWTVTQIHLATRKTRAERTIRLDCQTGALPAQKNPTWLIRADDAKTYIAAHRRT